MTEQKDTIKYLNDIPRNTYITLKEAAEITNYSSDYIGQLIRAGKIQGYQVYTNVSWVTTESAIRAYMESKGKVVDDAGEDARDVRIAHYVRYTLYVVIGILGCMLLILSYVFVAGIDRAVSDAYLKDYNTRLYGI